MFLCFCEFGYFRYLIEMEPCSIYPSVTVLLLLLFWLIIISSRKIHILTFGEGLNTTHHLKIKKNSYKYGPQGESWNKHVPPILFIKINKIHMLDQRRDRGSKTKTPNGEHREFISCILYFQWSHYSHYLGLTSISDKRCWKMICFSSSHWLWSKSK